MSTMTLTEKILARHAGRDHVDPDENIWVDADILMTHDVCGAVWRFGEAFVEGIRRAIEYCGVPIRVVGLPSFPSLVFDDMDTIQRDQLVTLYMQETAKRGLYGGPGLHFCFRHTETDLEQGLEILRAVMTVFRKALDDGDIIKFLECPVRQSSFRRLV